MQEEEWVYAIYATLDTKNRDIGYLFLDIQLYTVKEPEIPQEYADLQNIASKEGVQTLPNPILVEHKINIGDKEPPFKPLYSLLKNKLAVLYQYIVDNF